MKSKPAGPLLSWKVNILHPDPRESRCHQAGFFLTSLPVLDAPIPANVNGPERR